MGKPIADKGMICPQYRKDVSKVCHTCAWYVMLRGKNKNTGADVDEWGCAVAWGPIMAVETAHAANSTAAAIESFRNEMVKQNDHSLLQGVEDLKEMGGAIANGIRKLNGT